MRAYAYTAYDADGRKRRGTVVAETEAAATGQLKAQGLYVSDLGARGARSGRAARRARLSGDLQAVFARQMAVLLAADLTAEAALEAVRASGTGGALDQVAARARAGLLDGATLADALAASGAGFAPYVIAAIRAGETAGDPAGVFAELADHLEGARSDRARIATALVYPGFVAAVSLLVCAILMTTVAPEIVAMFEMSGRPLPDLTRVVLALSDAIRDNAVPLSALLAGLVLMALASARVPALRALRDRAALRLPVIGRLMRRAAAVQYLRTLALVLTARHPVPTAVDHAAGVLDVARFRREAGEVSRALSQGESLSRALDHLSIIPPVARQLVAAGEMSVRLARMTDRAAVLVENALSTERKRIAALLEPVLMMLVGGFVLLIVLAVLLPIFDLQAVVAG